MRSAIYGILVNRHPGIRVRYHRVHDRAAGMKKIISWLYLLWLNLCYYVFFCRFLGKEPKAAIYEEKRIPCDRSESSALSAAEYVSRLAQYDIVSFDIFDTLIFRPFSAPADLFFLLGEKMLFPDFKRIRMEAEALSRKEHYAKTGNYEVSLEEIWRILERESGLPADYGARMEEELELSLCYANPFLQEVYERLRGSGVRIVIISDMYLPEKFMEKLLRKNGFEGFERMFVSNAFEKSKGNGGLFREAAGQLRKEYGQDVRIIHVGDNPHSDVKMARKSGFDALHYPNTDALGSLHRPQDMSVLVGGAYRGIINHHLYCGMCGYSREYEYGYVYGGLFALGYCVFIHAYVKRHGIDRVLFLSRDGDILKRVYEMLYPGEDVRYAYWSRAAALKLTAGVNRYDYFRRFLHHKVNQGKRIRQILREMELEELSDELWRIMKAAGAEEVLTDKNVWFVQEYLTGNWEQILQIYEGQQSAAKKYYGQLLSGCRKAAAVDIGWAGSGAVALRILCEKVWKIPCEIIGLLAGTNSLHNAEPDAPAAFLQSGKLVSYLFSQSHNRDLYKKHDPAKDDNVFWELLLSSPTRQFLGFYPVRETDAEKKEGAETEILLRFGASEMNPHGCREIQRGIMDFAAQYHAHFVDYPFMLDVSGRDAYAPVLAAMGHGRRYLKRMAERFQMDIAVSCDDGDIYEKYACSAPETPRG